MGVPLFDCRVDERGQAAVARVLASGHLAAGPEVAGLESDLSVGLGGRPVVALSDMTQALAMALRLSGVGEGDDVLTLSYNCLSSNAAIHAVGATPVWVDLDPETASMSLDDARARLTPRTRAVVVYHVIGYPADMSGFRRLCDEYGLALIEDANNALGARLPSGAAAGTAGDFAVFSFYANRQVSAVEGAALACPTPEAAAKVRQWRRFGVDQAKFRDARGEIDPKADVPDLGSGASASLSNVSAALARSNLAQLDERLGRIRANAAEMTRALRGVEGVTLVRPVGDAVPAYWSLLLRCAARDNVMDVLKSAGVGCSKLHQPNHVYSGFRSAPTSLPATDRFMDEVLAVPCGWWVGDDQRRMIVDLIADASRKRI